MIIINGWQIDLRQNVSMAGSMRTHLITMGDLWTPEIKNFVGKLFLLLWEDYRVLLYNVIEEIFERYPKNKRQEIPRTVGDPLTHKRKYPFVRDGAEDSFSFWLQKEGLHCYLLWKEWWNILQGITRFMKWLIMITPVLLLRHLMFRFVFIFRSIYL